MKQIITYNTFSVDSLQIRIPFDKVKYYDKDKLDKHLIVNERTGEQIGMKNVSYKYSYDGLINVYFSINEYEVSKKKYKVLTILLSSKILKSSYFTGINKTNIKYIYNKLQSFNIASFDFLDFQRANVYDVDFKKDVTATNETITMILEGLMLKAKLSTKSGVGYKYYNTVNSDSKRDNIGLAFGNEKRVGNNNADVLLKFYSKRLELIKRSWGFYKEYFPNAEIKDTLRIEFTVKNQTRFNKLGIDKNFTLENILELTNEQLNSMYRIVINYHVKNTENLELKEVKRENTKIMDYIEIIMLLPTKKDYYETIQHNYMFAVKHIEVIHAKNKDKKSRYKKDLETMYFNMMNGSPIALNDEKDITTILNEIFPD